MFDKKKQCTIITQVSNNAHTLKIRIIVNNMDEYDKMQIIGKRKQCTNFKQFSYKTHTSKIQYQEHTCLVTIPIQLDHEGLLGTLGGRMF